MTKQVARPGYSCAAVKPSRLSMSYSAAQQGSVFAMQLPVVFLHGYRLCLM